MNYTITNDCIYQNIPVIAETAVPETALPPGRLISSLLVLVKTIKYYIKYRLSGYINHK